MHYPVDHIHQARMTKGVLGRVCRWRGQKEGSAEFEVQTLSDAGRKDGRMRWYPQFGCRHVLLFMGSFLMVVRNLAL